MSKLRDFIHDRLPLTARRGVTETASLIPKATKTKRSVTESRAEAADGRTPGEYIRSGTTGYVESPGPIPRFAAAAATFAAQVLGLGSDIPPTPPKLQAPAGWIPLDDVEQFILCRAKRHGVLWQPPLSVIMDFHRAMSPFNRRAMEKRTFFFENVPLVCLSEAGLVDLVAFKAPQLAAQQAQQQAPATSPLPPSRPSLEEQAQERAALAASDDVHQAKLWRWRASGSLQPVRPRKPGRSRRPRPTESKKMSEKVRRPRKGDGILITALATGKTIRQSAAAAGVNEQTVYRRLKDETFSAEVSRVRSETISLAAAKLAAASTRAVDRLVKLLKGQSESVQRSAAATILDASIKLRTADEFEARLQALEELLLPDGERK